MILECHFLSLVPPRIMPFRFLNDYLQEGRRLSVFCQILEGDKPIEFTWLHNAVPISSSASQVYPISGTLRICLHCHSSSVFVRACRWESQTSTRPHLSLTRFPLPTTEIIPVWRKTRQERTASLILSPSTVSNVFSSSLSAHFCIYSLFSCSATKMDTRAKRCDCSCWPVCYTWMPGSWSSCTENNVEASFEWVTDFQLNILVSHNFLFYRKSSGRLQGA